MAESDAKVVFQIELDDSKLRPNLNKVVRDIERQGGKNGPTVTVNADTSAATTALHKVKADAEGVESADPTVTVSATDAATDTLNDVKAKADAVEGTDPTVTVSATDTATTTLDDVKAKADAVEGADPTVTVNADTSAATTALDDVKAKADAVEGANPTVTVTATDAATTTLDDVKTKADAVEGADPTVTVSATDTATTTLDDVKAKADAVEGADPTVTVSATDTATTTLDDVKAKADAVESADPTVTVSADTATATTNLNDVKSKAHEVDNSDPTVTVTADTATATTNLDNAKAKADAVEGADPTVTVSADTGTATTNLDSAKSKADEVENSDPTVTVSADTATATTNLGGAKSKADEVENSDPTVTVSADTATAESSLNDILNTADKIRDHGLFKNGIKLGAGMKIGGALVSGAANAVKGAAGSVFSAGQSYESGLAKVSTLIPEGADMDAFGARLLQLSSETGQSIETLTEAAYNSLSASQSFGDATGGDLIDYLRLSSQLAVGGFSDTNSAALAMAKTLNAYSMDGSQSERVANVMMRTQNRGITDVDKLSASLANVTSVAAGANVSIEEVGAMIATVTAQGKETAEATTMSRTLLAELLKDDTEANKSMKAALKGTAYSGMGLSEIMAAGGNIVDILSAMQAYADKKGKSILDLFSSTEAGMGAQFLLKEGGATYLDNLEYMNGEEDTVGNAYGKMMQTTSASLDKIKQQFMGYAASLYAALAPAMQKLLGVVTGEKFRIVAATLINKITAMLEGDFFNKVIDALIVVADIILGLLNGDIKLTDLLQGIFEWLWQGLESVLDRILNSLLNGLIDIINEIIKLINAPLSIMGMGRLGLIEHVGEDEGDKPFSGGGARREKEPTPEEQRRAELQALLDERSVRNADSLYQFSNTELFAPLLDAAAELGYEWAVSIKTAMDAGVEGYRALSESKRGDKDSENTGTNVADTQAALKALGFDPGEIDGIYGKNTQAAVKAFQESKGLEATGQADEATVNAMNTAMLESAASTEGATESTSIFGTTAEKVTKTLTKAEGELWLASQALVNKIRSLKPSVSVNVSVSGGGLTQKPKMSAYAVGLDTVPYDNYPALLHKGETVLNAAEASAYRMYQNGASFGGGIDYDALARAMSNLSLDMDGQKVGRLTERGVSDAQGRRFARMTRRG